MRRLSTLSQEILVDLSCSKTSGRWEVVRDWQKASDFMIVRVPRVLASLLLVSALYGLSGCTAREDQRAVAGKAYVEDEQGNLVAADESSMHGVSPAPSRSDDGGSQKEWLTEFELIERSGQTVGTDDLKGQPYIVSFFFTTCPTICKRQNEKVQLLQEQFKGQPIRFVSITCDPDVDNPEVLSIYADQFKADPQQWLFLTGEFETIRRVGTEIFFLPVDRRFHADKFLLVDADGNIFRSYEWPDDKAWQSLLADVQLMLDNGGRLPAS